MQLKTVHALFQYANESFLLQGFLATGHEKANAPPERGTGLHLSSLFDKQHTPHAGPVFSSSTSNGSQSI